MRIAAKVRQEKEQHPERFCRDARCLWRVQHPGRPDTPCPKHPREDHDCSYEHGDGACAQCAALAKQGRHA